MKFRVTKAMGNIFKCIFPPMSGNKAMHYLFCFVISSSVFIFLLHYCFLVISTSYDKADWLL